MPQEKPEACQDPRPLVLPELRKRKGNTGIGVEAITMPFVKCSVNGCSRKLQPILKVDPRDRDTWFYRECEVCLKPACEEHSSGVADRIICDRCRREGEAQQRSAGLIDLGFRQRREAD